MSGFRVDTHLFRELGELLVGRDSTALVELVKNSYDADATEVTVLGTNLRETHGGLLSIADNGVGMSADAFERGFLTIAGRTKNTPTRRSARYGRRYTGAKGIGRLATHKLARRVEIESVVTGRGGDKPGGLLASIDWDELETFELIDEAGEAISVEARALPKGARSGTTITLAPLRRRWTERQLVTFLAEVQAFEPPKLFRTPLSPDLLGAPPLFDVPQLRDVSRKDPGFRVRLEGDLDLGDPLWEAVESSASWVLDIDAQAKGITYRVVPTVQTTQKTAAAQPSSVSAAHPMPEEGPFFQARILIREGEQPGSNAVKAWAAAASGIRIFMEGFRVLPYGERSDDWLDIAVESTSRSNRLSALGSPKGLSFLRNSLPEEAEREGLSALAPSHYFGAVLLTEAGAPNLRMLVNREGFIPDEAFESLARIVRTGVHLSIRVRAAASHERRQRRASERRDRPKEAPADMAPVLSEVTDLVKKARTDLAENRIQDAVESTARVAESMNRLRSEVSVLEDEQSLIRVVASVGMQMSAFIHELNALVGGARATEQSLRALRMEGGLPVAARREIGRAERAVNSLRQGLERQASFLTDVVSADARRRRSRQLVSERFEAAMRLLASTAERRGVSVVNQIPADLRTRPMFPAELTAVISNLLTNAMKAAGDGGRIVAVGSETAEGTLLRIENSGTEVDLEESERWFRPFESTTVEVDAALGQGMGLGLPITRMMVEQYGGSVRFVEPQGDGATAVEVMFPKK